MFPDETMADAANYCRNPVEPQPWCYTLDKVKKRGFCDIPLCGECSVILIL